MLERVGPAPRIAVEHAGAGELVVLLHGIGGNRTNWREQIDELAGQFHVCAWDARGYGESDDYAGPLELADFSRDLARVLDHFGERAAHLVGLSMGGVIAQDFYRRHPDRVRSLVLAATRRSLQRHNAAEFLRLREAPLLAGKTPRDIAPDLVRALAGPNASAAVRRRLEESIGALHEASYLKALRATTSDAAGDIVELGSVRVPTLVVCGTEDAVNPPPLSRAIAAGIPGARLVWIEGAGHLCNIEAPEKFNAALLEFLA
jgi:3-oxoadipate enol-lactonase